MRQYVLVAWGGWQHCMIPSTLPQWSYLRGKSNPLTDYSCKLLQTKLLRRRYDHDLTADLTSIVRSDKAHRH